MDGLVEKVRDAVCGARCDPERPDPGKGLDEFIARAAIVAVFDALAEPSDDAMCAGAEAWHSVIGLDESIYAAMRAYLATLRKQALG